jgi:ADP-heptose:LPS heptosyltransferase
LLTRFPNTRFILTGFRRELTDDDTPQLEAMLRQRNVVNGLDCFSADQLVRLIAHARAVVTNDTSAAHIANLFGVSGAVLFGPVSPGTFASPAGLRVFHDATCPYHPCVQWKCSNEANWCMEKISPATVGDYLATVLSLPNEHTLADVAS